MARELIGKRLPPPFRDGAFWLGSWLPLKELDGGIRNVMTVSRDITERKKMEETLRQSEVQFRAIFDHAPVGIVKASPEGTWLLINQCLCEITGYTREELLAKSFRDITHPDDLAADLAALAQFRTGEISTYASEKRYIHKNGSAIFVHVTVTAVMESKGDTRYFITIVNNITERKRIQEALRESDEKYRLLINNANDGIAIIQNGIVKFVNKGLARMYGDSIKNIVGIEFEKFIHPTEIPNVVDRFRRRVQGENVPSIYESKLLRADGSAVDVELNASLMHMEGGRAVQVIIRDISERKRVEEQVRQSVRRANAMLEAIPDLVFRFDARGTVLDFKAEDNDLYTEPDTIVGKRVQDVLPPDLSSVVDHHLAAALRTNEIQTFDYELVIPKKGLRHYEARMAASGREEVVAIIRDTTSRKQAEDELRESQQMLHTVLNAIPVRVFWKDGDLNYLGCNESFARDGGFDSPRSIIGKNDFQAGWKEQAELYRADDREVIDTGIEKLGYEEPQTATDGSRIWLRTNKVPLRDSKGSIRGVLGTYEDITKSKNNEIALRESEDRYRSLFDGMMDGVYRSTEEGKFLSVNNAMVTMFGYESKEELMSVDIKRDLYFAPEDRVHACKEDKRSGMELFRMRKKDGSEIWVEDHGQLIHDVEGNVVYHEGILRDVTERRRTELLQHAIYYVSQSMDHATELVDLFKSVHDIIARVMPARNFFVALHDAKSGNITFPYFVDERDSPPRERKLDTSLTAYVLKTGHPILCDAALDVELCRSGNITANGMKAAIWLGVPLIIDGITIGVMVVQHYTDPKAYGEREKELIEYVATQVAGTIRRKKAEEALRESQQQYYRLVQTMNEGMLHVDNDDRILFVNDYFCSMIGYSREELLGNIANEMFTIEEDRTTLLEKNAQRREGISETYKTRLRKKSGEVIHGKIVGTPIRNDHGEVVGSLGMITDITQERSLEDQLRQAQKLESLGTLAGGIAHDFNNILGIIIGHASILQRMPGGPQAIEKNTEIISKAAMRGAALVKQLLTFARKSDVVVESVKLNDTVEEVRKLLSETFPKNITLSLNLDQALPRIKADGTQLHQVLLNLCVNARDAMPNGGTLAISTRRESGAIARKNNLGVTAEEYVVLSLTDTGIGMDEATRLRIFEPFFTTKPLGKGTGLGLSLVFGIMESHGGFVTVESEEGKGTSFQCYFPVPEEASAERREEARPEQDEPRGSETILLVEDEEMLRHLVRIVLEAKGYTVLTAGDGMEAVSQFKEHQTTIQLVISDVGLPKMNGEELFGHLRSASPGIPFILASGYFEPGLRSRVLMAGVNEIINKPYDPSEVLCAIRGVLDGKA